MALPAPVDELLRDAHVVGVPMRVPFRGVRVREALLLPGPAGGASSRPSWSTTTTRRRAGWPAASRPPGPGGLLRAAPRSR
jgi:O-succinylbenzoate synthase